MFHARANPRHSLLRFSVHGRKGFLHMSHHPFFFFYYCMTDILFFSAFYILGVNIRKRELTLQFSSVAQLCLTLCDPMNRSTPGLPVHHQLSEFTQTHFHRVGDAIQPSHPLSSPSPPAPNACQHHEVAKVLELQLQHQSFQ